MSDFRAEYSAFLGRIRSRDQVFDEPLKDLTIRLFLLSRAEYSINKAASLLVCSPDLWPERLHEVGYKDAYEHEAEELRPEVEKAVVVAAAHLGPEDGVVALEEGDEVQAHVGVEEFEREAFREEMRLVLAMSSVVLTVRQDLRNFAEQGLGCLLGQSTTREGEQFLICSIITCLSLFFSSKKGTLSI